MAGEEADKNPLLPEIINLKVRTARLEERMDGLENVIGEVKHRLEKVDNRLWWIISGLIVSIALQILWRLI